MGKAERELNLHQTINDAAIDFSAHVLLNLYPTEIERLAQLIEAKDADAIASMLREAAARSSGTRPDPDAIRTKVEDRMWPSEAAEFLGLDVDKLRRLADDGRIPCTRSFAGVREFSRAVLTALKPNLDEILRRKA